MSAPIVTLHQADCLDVLRTMPDASVHAIVTDPPYGLADHKPSAIVTALTAWANGDRASVPDGKGFMGRSWDAFVPPPAVWDECLRVLKPGGHMLVFAGTRTVDLMGLSVRMAGFEIRDSVAWMHGQGMPKGKTQLKPAFEPILMCRKPLVGTLVRNVAEHGTGAVNIDNCRIAHANEADLAESVNKNRHGDFASGPRSNEVFGKDSKDRPQYDGSAGRWPTNVVLDEHMAPELDAQSLAGGMHSAGKARKHYTNNGAGIFGQGGDGPANNGGRFGDDGGASRFFPVFRYQAKAPTKERPKVDGKSHPTVKPLELMRWLVRLVTPPGGTVLDPFAGSGTTGQAAALEGFECVLIEFEAEHIPLIEKRLTDAEIDYELVVSEPVAPEPTLLDLIEAADGDPEMTALWEAHQDEWTDEHTAAVRARLQRVAA